MSSRRVRLGRSAEIAAAAELGRRGYRIVASNYRCRQGEIDLIAEEDGVLVFVEVRCKTTGTYGSPAESITRAKIHKLTATAERYLEEHGVPDGGCRFDVVEVVPVDGRLCVAGVIRGAFTA